MRAKKPAVSLLQESFYAITSATAEQKYGARFPWIKFKMEIAYCNQTINITSKVCISGIEINVLESGSIVTHFSRAL
jgi:hypothetical protein